MPPPGSAAAGHGEKVELCAGVRGDPVLDRVHGPVVPRHLFGRTFFRALFGKKGLRALKKGSMRKTNRATHSVLLHRTVYGASFAPAQNRQVDTQYITMLTALPLRQKVCDAEELQRQSAIGK